MAEFDLILNRAHQFSPGAPMPPANDADIFNVEPYREEFRSEAFPQFNGPVALRFPSWGDTVENERLAARLGGTSYALVHAALHNCLESAPASWWRVNTEAKRIEPALDRLLDSDAMTGLYMRWIKWRDSFRDGAPKPLERTPVQDAGTAVGGGTGA